MVGVTPSPASLTGDVATTILAEPIWPFRQHISLMHGWVPVTMQLLALVALVLAIGWRNRQWRLVGLPLAALLGAGAIAATHWSISSNGLSGEPAPRALWVWVGLTGLAAGVVVFGWRSAQRWRRGVSFLALPMAALCTGLMLNLWYGSLC